MSALCSIYKISNKVNDKIYIGQTWKSIHDRFKSHKQITYKGCVKLHAAFNKYGRNNFTIELLTLCGTQESADYWEDYFIHKHNTILNGYNCIRGGKPSQFEKKKKTDYTKGKVFSETHRKNISLSRKGLKLSKEHKEKIGASRKGKKRKPFTEEHKRAISDAAKRRKPRQH